MRRDFNRHWTFAIFGFATCCTLGLWGSALAATFVSDTYSGRGLGYFVYTGRWEHLKHAHDARFFGTSSRTAASGATLSLSFIGRIVRLYGVRGRGGGYAGVTLDGRIYPDINFYASDVLVRALVFSSPLLTKGKHTLVVRVRSGPPAHGHRNTFVNVSGAVYE